jgi:cytochrome P450
VTRGRSRGRAYASAIFDPLDATAADNLDGLARLRAEAPVHRCPAGAWFLARYDDVLAATKDVETFRASFREPGVVVPDEEQFINEIAEPRHGHVRRIINSAIAQHRIGRVEPVARDLCERLLDDLLARSADGNVDLVAGYSTPIPTTVIAHLLGAPVEDHHRWAEWSDEVVQGTYPTKYRTERGVGLEGAHPEFTAYVDAQIRMRRDAAEPPDDFITRLLETEVDGRRLTDVEARTQLVFLFISGNETTRHLIGNLLWTVAQDPELYASLRADRALVPTAVEESLRHDPPIRFLLRNCMQEHDLHGEHLEPGDKVAFGILSANRDAAHFDDPDDFRLDRPDPKHHLAFGGGPHICPGAALARLEARIAIETLLTRVGALTLDPEYRFEKVPVFWAYGPSSLPVSLAAA